MENFDKNIDLIYKYLHNEISDEEKKEFDKLLQNEKFRRLFEDTRKLLELTDKNISPAILDIDIEKEWKIQQQKIAEKQSSKTKILFLNRKIAYFAFGLAASLIIFFGLFFFTANRQKTVIAEDSIVTVQLPDNSEILLNRNTKIKYPANFSKNRTVKLEGDAYFNVVHNPERPFVVSAGDYFVEDVGTEFYVSVDSANFEVYVTSGMVKVYGKSGFTDTIILNAGQKFFSNGNTTMKDSIKNNNFLAWKTGKIVFKDQKLSEIAKILEKTYGVHMEFADASLKNLSMTATFDNQSFESIAKVIEATLNIKIIKQKNKYIITRK